MNFFFDYIWYRIAKLYIKRDSDGLTASAFLSICQGSFLSSLIKIFIKYSGGIDDRIPLEKWVLVDYVVPVSIFIPFIYNYFHYKSKYWKFREALKDEEKDVTYYLKGLLILIIIFFPLILLMYLNSTMSLY